MQFSKPAGPRERQEMDSAIPFIILIVLGIPTAVVIWLIVRAVGAGHRLEELSRRLQDMELELIRLKRDQAGAPTPPATPAAQPTPASVAPPEEPLAPFRVDENPLRPGAKMWADSTVWQPVPAPVTCPAPPPAPTPVLESRPPWPIPPTAATAFRPSTPPLPQINWEQFMGVKGFAWIGGFALFLGVAFFVKYSFDNNLVPPALRVAIGFLTGLGLLVGGIALSRKNFAVLAQTLWATGIVILYAVTFACRSVYHFEFFGPVPTFLLMVLITTTAFLLAVRMNALVVAILGMLGGFLTPVLLATGQDNPLGLFGYLAILDAGLIAVALNRRWHFLVALAALGTGLMQAGWAEKFFESEQYFAGNKILLALAALLGFNLLYLAASRWAKSRGQTNDWLSGSTLGLTAVAMALSAWFTSFTPLAQRPGLMFGFLFVLDAVAIGLTLVDRKMSRAQPLAGFAIFSVLAWWTRNFLSMDLLNTALVFYFLFAVVHTGLPVLLQRRFGLPGPTLVNHAFPMVALGLVLVPVFQLASPSWLVWPVILLVDLLALALAVCTATLLPVLVVLVLTLAATGLLIFKIPADLTGLTPDFLLLGAFAIFFMVAGVWLVRKFKPAAFTTGIDLSHPLATPAAVAAVLPACSIILPFLLLIMVSTRLPMINPSPLFGLALLLVLLLLGITRLFALDALPAVGLLCLAALECTWHFRNLDPTDSEQPMKLILAWYLIFYTAFTLFPFLFWRRFMDRVSPWAVAALVGVPQFLLIHRFVSAVHPNAFVGLLPAAFAVPALVGLVVILKKIPAAIPARLSQIAWFGGVALFFITLIFPLQFDRQWLTLGWALEGVALLWLFHRVPHPGLRLAGTGLLVAAFVRLAFNPAVLEYHARATTAIFNWYLYAYGLVTVCLFAGAKLLAPPRQFILQTNAPPLLATQGTILLFLLLNIEIADFFSMPGATLAFEFSGSFARDMTYSIAWALFALALLIYGIMKTTASARYAAMGLLGVVLLKLFLHDLAQLGPLYRIGAFIGVAVVAMLASFAYQKFFSANPKLKEPPHETPS